MRENGTFVVLAALGVAATLGSVVLAGSGIVAARRPPPAPVIMSGVSGPEGVSKVERAVAADWRRFDAPGGQPLAVLLTDTASAWLGLAHGLAAAGIPFTITRDWRSAVAHRVVWVYPLISGRVVAPDGLRALSGLPRSGGTLIGTQVLGGGLEEVFGFDRATESRHRQRLRFTEQGATRFAFDHQREREIRLGASRLPWAEAAIGSVGYRRTSAQVLAEFDDGTAALTHRQVGGGHAYAIGVDPGALMLIGYGNRDEGLARSYVNSYEPTIDVFLRVARAVYDAGEPEAVTVGTVPQGRELSVLLTHDVDYAKSWDNALVYARFERSRGVVGTYFVQTKYVRDYNDAVFFDTVGVRYTRALGALGAEIGSHSVSHARVFDHFPLGTGTETYPAYVPIVRARDVAEGGTILGELRVSKFLLDYSLGRSAVASFRPGELANPFSLPQALEATGYRYSSSTTANKALTHLPFRLTYSRGPAAESDVYEFPVTIEDEEPPAMDRRVGEALALADRVARYGGVVVVLIHPNVAAEKLVFEQRFVDALDGRAWFGTVAAFGAWWVARDRLRLAVAREGEARVVTITAPLPIDAVSVQVPPGWVLAGAERGATQVGRSVLIAHLDGERRLTFGMPATPAP